MEGLGCADSANGSRSNPGMEGAWFCPLDGGSELDEALAVPLPDFTAALESLSVLSSSELLKEENNNEKSFP